MAKLILSLSVVIAFAIIAAPVVNAGCDAVYKIRSALSVIDNAPANYETHRK